MGAQELELGSGARALPDPQHGESGGPSAASSQAALLSAILTGASTLVATLDLDTLLANLLPQVAGALGQVSCGILWLYERQSGKLWAVSTYGLPAVADSPAPVPQTFPIAPGEALAGQAYQRNACLRVDGKTAYHTQTETITGPSKAAFQQRIEQLPRSLMVVCVPLQAGDDRLGVLELMHTPAPADEAEPPPDLATEATSRASMLLFADTHLLQHFANLVAAAIKNARMYGESQRQYHRLNAFNAVVTAISTATDLADMVNSVLDVVLGFLPIACGTILIFDPSQARLSLAAQRGLPAAYVALLHNCRLSEGPCTETIHYGQPIIRPLMEDRGELLLLNSGLASCAYLPLLAGGTVVGVLGLYGDALLHKNIDLEALMPLCNQVGFAIANVRLYEASQIERHKLNTVVNSSAEGVMLCDSQGRLVLANEAAMRLLNLESIPFEQHLRDMPGYYGMYDMDGHLLTEEQLPMARALQGETFHDYRILTQGSGGANSVMSFSGAPARSNAGSIEGAVVTFRDITASQRLERAKDEFLAIAAHELRSPLVSVRSYSDMLMKRERQRNEENARDLRGLTILSQQVTHMLRMVDNLLDMSKIEAGQVALQMQEVNLVSLVSQVFDQKRPEAANRELLLESDEPEIMIQCDSMRIRQVLTNLVGNAIKYSPPDSPVTVRLAVVEHEGQREVLVAVNDKGSGIPPDQQSRLFQRFYRVKNRRRIEGLGLGLYLSREFVVMHGGRIWGESVEGKGTTFYFSLPVSGPERPAAQAAEE